MSRWDVKVVFTQEFTLVVEADTAEEARNLASGQMSEHDRVRNPESSEMRMVVTRGVT